MAEGVVPISPRQIDPLGWITGPMVPLVFAGLSSAYALRALLVDGVRAIPPLQVLAALLLVGALVLLHLSSRGVRGTISTRAAIAAATVGVVALGVSAIGYRGDDFAIELWWAPMSLGLVLASLGPYFSWQRIAAICGTATAVAAAIATPLLAPGIRDWGPVAVAVLIAVPPLSGGWLAAVFSRYVVRRMRALLEARSQNVLVAGPAQDAETELVERARLAQLTARAVPFLEGVADRGEIASADRAMAGQLARRLRDDLVTQASASWLDRAGSDSRLVVIDPDGRADALRPSQRTALRHLITALLGSPSVDAESLLVELRAADGGATAVGISMDAELPEGRRMMYLAPSLLTLEMTADDITWVGDEFVRVTFLFPPEPPGPPGTRS